MSNKLFRISFFLAATICITSRVILKLFFIDPQTGYYENTGGLEIVFNGFLGIFVAVLLLRGWYLKKKALSASITYHSLTCLFAILSGISTLWFGYDIFMSRIDSIYFDFSGFSFSVLLAMLILLLKIICFAVAPIVTGILLFKIAFSSKNTATPVSLNGWLMLFPLIWQTSILLSCFMEYTSILHTSDQMLFVLMLMLSCLFWLAYARLVSNVDSSKGIYQFHLFAPAFVLVSLTVAIGGWVSEITGCSVSIAFPLSASIFYTMTGIYAAIVYFSLQLQSAKK